MNFKRFKEVYPVYRDMGAMCDKAYNQAKELDLFNTREIESLKEQNRELVKWINRAKPYSQHIYGCTKGMCGCGFHSLVEKGEELLKEGK